MPKTTSPLKTPKVVTFGEIMLRLNPPDKLRFEQADNFQARYGGAEANVAVSLANYGVDSHYVSRLPADNPLAEAALQSLRRYNIDCQDSVRGGRRMGVYYLEFGAVQRASRVVYDREGSGMATLEPGMIDWEAALDGADWFHWTGITPALSQSAADSCLEAVETAHRLGVNISLDLNYRGKLWGYGKKPIDVMPELAQYATLVSGDPMTANTFFGTDFDDVDFADDEPLDGERMRPFAEGLKKHLPNCKYVTSTLRASINADHNRWSAILLTEDGLLTTKDYELTDMVDRIGGGDSYMGALLYGLTRANKNDQYALDFATAASCLKHTIYGDVNLVSVGEVEELLAGGGSGKVKR